MSSNHGASSSTVNADEAGGGYDVDTVDPAKEGLLCSECRLVLKQAVQTPEGNRLCQGCFNSISQ